MRTALSQSAVEQGWWAFGFLVLRWSDWLWWWATLATKIFVLLLLIGTIASIFVYFKLRLPTIQIDWVKDRFESSKKAVSKTKSAAKAAVKRASDDRDDDELITGSKTKASTATAKKTAAKESMKSLLKDKLSKSVQNKEDEASMKQLHINFPSDKPTFDINILEKGSNSGPTIEESWLIEKAEAIKDKLAEFNIDITIEWFNVWPTVVQFKLAPQSWIKISKIESYTQDISLALKTKSIRVLAPIPGTDKVWIEVPNPSPQMVRLSETLGSIDFTKWMSKNLTNLAIGKWIDWNHIVKPLEKMPHLLVAWATWSGKSVWVNDFITSLMYQNTPSELKFIMVDPKQVELWMYEWIPYLLAPIITQADKAVKVLRWAVEYMEQRYKLLKDNKVRNLDEYNAKVKEDEKMYRLVIIIDELADLMMSWNKKDTETYIARIAQKARAVWIHLILATQRPSVNVITGIIKANIPTRIAYAVVSQIDSRTILDCKGAEDLVGRWDLLYSSAEYKYPVRVQSPFIDTPETEALVHAIKQKYMQGISENDIYHPEIMRILENKWEFAGASWKLSGDDEDLIEQAIEIIMTKRKASATMLQRTLWVWFPRAARLLDVLEERWVVWPQEWAKAREIFV